MIVAFIVAAVVAAVVIAGAFVGLVMLIAVGIKRRGEHHAELRHYEQHKRHRLP